MYKNKWKGFLFCQKQFRSSINIGERQLNDLHDCVQFISDKFKKYEEDWAKKLEILGNLQSEVGTLSRKVSTLEKQAEQQ